LHLHVVMQITIINSCLQHSRLLCNSLKYIYYTNYLVQTECSLTFVMCCSDVLMYPLHFALISQPSSWSPACLLNKVKPLPSAVSVELDLSFSHCEFDQSHQHVLPSPTLLIKKLLTLSLKLAPCCLF